MTERTKLAIQMPIAAIDSWPDGLYMGKFTLDVYIADPGMIHAEARRQEDQYGGVVWDSIQEILDWECVNGLASNRENDGPGRQSTA